MNSKKLSRQVSLAGSLLLISVLVIINIRSGAFNILILAAQLVPIALTLPGLIKGNSRNYQWQCFVVLFFLVQGILLAFTPGWFMLGIIESMICLLLFFSAIIFIRAARISPG